MFTKALVATALLTSLVAPLAALADGEVEQRIDNQQARINQGVRNGSLTQREYHRLDNGLDRIQAQRASAEKVREVKHAEGDAQVRVLQAKSESDAMQYTLPLKEKQIQQTRLEAEARKESTVKNAEAAAQAKVIDSKAENERRKLLSAAEADRIRVTAAADAERLSSEAAILKQNPLLINKIVAERLSDKLQIMMVPADGKFFFANDVLRSMSVANQAGQVEQEQPR